MLDKVELARKEDPDRAHQPKRRNDQQLQKH